jgi:hypothetical protein
MVAPNAPIDSVPAFPCRKAPGCLFAGKRALAVRSGPHPGHTATSLGGLPLFWREHARAGEKTVPRPQDERSCAGQGSGTRKRPQAYSGVMKRGLFPLLAIISVSAALVVPSAEAKFRLSVTMEPARPTARSGARVLLRTDIDLPRKHGIRLFAVGPWRKNLGQAFFEIRLMRIAPRTLTGRVRFPHPGRWHLNVPPPGASPYVDLWVSVRPPA